VRRQFLGLAAPAQSSCPVDLSFSYLIAQRYLFDHSIQAGAKTKAGDPTIGNVILTHLQQDTAGYHQLNDGGDQILLNYRATDSVAPQLTLREVLQGNKLNPDLVRGKIVLIGTTDESYGDLHLTPYSQDRFDKMPGVVIQAHMVSQIISAVLDKRPLIWWFPKWGEVIWIGVWTLTGSMIVWRLKSPPMIWLVTGGAIAILFGCCYGLLLMGGWVPLVPPALTLIATSAWVVIDPQLRKENH
jgi:CHASE2 domain-containing sensor protein